jgi:uncharacterized membrane protein
MEIFLLLLDELDDAAATARMLLPRVLGFLLALGVFALSIVIALYWPGLAIAVLLLVLSVAILPALRQTPFLRVKTDP